jgi:CubicO group peptidase (beta-lactamase class C family)
MKRVVLLSALAATTTFLSAAQPAVVKRLDGTTITPVEIDATLNRLMGAAEVPGAAITLFNHGQVVYQKAYGVRPRFLFEDLGRRIYVTANREDRVTEMVFETGGQTRHFKRIE